LAHSLLLLRIAKVFGQYQVSSSTPCRSNSARRKGTYHFKSLPYELEIAGNGLIAIDKFKASAHDVVLMDVRMPEMDGLTATRLLRQWEPERGLPPAPIIALTASALAEDVERSLAAGCNAHVSKPVRKRGMLEAIRSVIATNASPTDATAAPAASSP